MRANKSKGPAPLSVRPWTCELWWVCEWGTTEGTLGTCDRWYPIEGPFKTRVEAEWCLRKRVQI